MSDNLTTEELARQLAWYVSLYEPAKEAAVDQVLHDMILAIMDKYADIHNLLKPQDKHLPALFRAIDNALDNY